MSPHPQPSSSSPPLIASCSVSFTQCIYYLSCARPNHLKPVFVILPPNLGLSLPVHFAHPPKKCLFMPNSLSRMYFIACKNLHCSSLQIMPVPLQPLFHHRCILTTDHLVYKQEPPAELHLSACLSSSQTKRGSVLSDEITPSS